MSSFNYVGCCYENDIGSNYIDTMPLFAKELIGGATTGAVTKSAVAPLERIKILYQTRTQGFQSIGVYPSFTKVIKHEGLLGLYKGNGAAVLRVLPYSGFHYMAYERYRSWLVNTCPSVGTGPVVDLIAGSAAGGTAVLCTYPLDLARTKLAYQVVDRRQFYVNGNKCIHSNPAYRGLQDVFRSVYKENGVRGFYRGVGPTLVGIFPYAGLKFYLYEELKLRIPEEQRDSIPMRLSCGASAGLVAQTFSYPLDVIRRQMQINNAQKGKVQYKNTMECVRNIVRNQGWRQLYAGLSVNYLKVVPSVAIGFTVYDVMKLWLRMPS
ncbi:hypothetical protein ACFE04_008561 [Oxalis oulophora]